MSKIFVTNSLEDLTLRRYIEDALRRGDPTLGQKGFSREFFLSKGVSHNDLNDLDSDERQRDERIIEVAGKLGLNPAIIYWVAKQDTLSRHGLRMFALREAEGRDFFVRIGAVGIPDIFPGKNFYHAMHNAIMGLDLRKTNRISFRIIARDLREYHKSAEKDSGRIPPKGFPQRGFGPLSDMLLEKLDPANIKGIAGLLGFGLRIFFGQAANPHLAFSFAPDGTLIFPQSVSAEPDLAFELDGGPIKKKASHAKYTAPPQDEPSLPAAAQSGVFEEYWKKNQERLKRHFDIVEVKANFHIGDSRKIGDPVTIGAVMAPAGFTSPVKEILHMIETAGKKGLAKGAENERLMNILERLSKDANKRRRVSNHTYNELAEFLFNAFYLQDVTTIPDIVKALKICLNHMGVRDHLPLVVKQFGEERFAAPAEFSHVFVGNAKLERLSLDAEYVWKEGAITPAEYFRRRLILLKRDFEILPAAYKDKDEMPKSKNLGTIVIPDGFSSIIIDVGQALAEIHLGGVKGLQMSDDMSNMIDELVRGSRAEFSETNLNNVAGLLLTFFELHGKKVTWQDCFSALLLYTNHDNVLDFLPLTKSGSKIVYGRSGVLTDHSIYSGVRNQVDQCIDGDYRSLQMETDVFLGHVKTGRDAPKKLLEMFSPKSLFDKMEFVIERSFEGSNRRLMLGLVAHVISENKERWPDDLRTPVADLLTKFRAKAGSLGFKGEAEEAKKLITRLGKASPKTQGGGAGTSACRVFQPAEFAPAVWSNGGLLGAGTFPSAPIFPVMTMPFTFI